MVLSDPDSPIVFVASQASEYGSDFVKFKSSLKAQVVRREGAAQEFAGLTFFGPKRSGLGGYTFDSLDLKTFDSPFVRSPWASGVNYFREGEERLLFDLSVAGKPVKSIDPALTANIPGRTGEARPIVFQAK